MPDGTNTYDTVHPAITDVVSRPRDNIVLLHGNSSEDTYDAMAFQVLRTNRRIERVTNQFTLAAGSTQEFGYFGENGFSRNTSNPGDDVFQVDSERDNTIVEYGFAVEPDGVYVGVRPVDDDEVNGLREGSDRDRGFSADDLPTRGGVLSDFTKVDAPDPTLDFTMPTTALSASPDHGIYRIDSRENGTNNIYFAFNNQSGAQVTMDIWGVGQTYEVRQIKDEQTVREMVKGEKYNRQLSTYGGFGTTKPNLPQDWYQHRVSIGPGELTP
jgi:hypothetical protein